MNIPCSKASHFCPCTDNPLANLSSEAPDRELFTHIDYSEILGPPPVLLCEAESLEDLANCPHICNPDIETCPCDSGNECCDSSTCQPCQNNSCCSTPPCTPVLFFNHETSCTMCDFTYTVPAGTISSSISQADADERARSICLYRACNGPPGLRRIPLIPGIVCPVITGVTPPPPVNANSGDSVTLTVLFTYTGMGTLTFTWFKDGTPFSVTPGASITFNPAQTSDSGFYTLSIKATGCPPVVSPEIQLNVAIGDCTGIPVPSNLLETDNTVYDTTGQADTFKESLVDPGKYRVKYISGEYETCFHANADCSGALTLAFTTAPASTRGEFFHVPSSTWIALFGPVIDYTAFGPTCPAGKTANALAAFHADSPDSWLVDGTPAPIEFVLDDFGPSSPQPKIRTKDGMPLSACNGAGGTFTGGIVNNIVRVGKFISEPYSVTIDDFLAFMSSCKPITADGPNCFPAWGGVVDEDFHMGETVYEIQNLTEQCFENLHITNVFLHLVPGVRWVITITGFWSELGVDQPEETLWEGQKTCGTTPLGIYTKISSFVAGASDTLVLV